MLLSCNAFIYVEFSENFVEDKIYSNTIVLIVTKF